MKRYRVDLHTHSKLSPDGSIDENDYKNILQKHQLDFVAITDHNAVEYALYCQKKLGNQIIVGEEISTVQGHLIGLFLHKMIKPHQDVLKSAEEIKSQGGLVYIPHAFDVFRHGIGLKQLQRLLPLIDILEVYNGRMIIPFLNHKAKQFAVKHTLTQGFGSDSHFAESLGKGALILSKIPTAKFITFANGSIDSTQDSPLRFLIPKYNRLQKIFNK